MKLWLCYGYICLIYWNCRLIWLILISEYNINVLIYNYTIMILENIYSKIKEEHYNIYNWLMTLDKLYLIDIATIEWRFEMLLEILKLRKSLKIWYFVQLDKWYDNLTILEFLSKAQTYNTSISIVWSKLKYIAEWIAYEIEKVNDWIYNFELIDKILSWTEDISSFINTLNWVNDSISKRVITWLSWKLYTIKWYNALSIYNTEEIKDILQSKDWFEWYEEIIKFVLNKDNFVFIKERYANLRLWLMSILKEIINPDDKSKLIQAIIDNNLLPQPDTKETNVVDIKENI